MRKLSYPIFGEYQSAIRDFAVGCDRLYWNREALFALDIRFEEVNARFRDPVHLACWDIIDRYAATAGK
ncbi:MAG TPA: hypothetical protein VGB55_10225 [Tepidisphaeraceae bacterium]|jgi:hypothetical protein